MNKKLIRLTEQDLHKIVKESVNRIINEIGDSPKGQFMLGRTYRRAEKRGDKDTAISASNKAWDRSEGGGRNYRNFKSGIDFQDDMDTNKAYKNLGKLLNHSVKESVNRILKEGEFNSDDYYVDDATSTSISSINESDYNGYFDWAEKSGASNNEIEAAGKKHDERNKGNSFHGDKLAYRQHTNQMFKDRGENPERQKDFKKEIIKRQRKGWRF